MRMIHRPQQLVPLRGQSGHLFHFTPRGKVHAKGK